jgi:outer membrane protein OmpA-like peptidoglycan-associated protein
MFQKGIQILLAFLLTVNVIPLIGQYSDCDNMKVLTDSVYFAKNITGYGKKLEFSKNIIDSKNTFENETNSRWYLITMPDSGLFTFDIKTLNKSNDWDFILYRHKNMFCKRIDDNKIKPIRSNLSRSSETGLSLKATRKFVGAGINENYCKPVVVQKGEKLVLVINNPKKSNQSHTLILHYPKTIKKAVKKEVVKQKDFLSIKFILSIKDKLTKEVVSADVNINGFSKNPIFLKEITNYETSILKKKHKAVINASAKGYMLHSVELHVFAKAKVIPKDIYLDQIESGKKVNLKNIQFYGNRYDFLPSAKSALKTVLSFMRLNNSVKIEIEGHVNGPGQKNSADYKELSNNRAKAVKAYLVKNGINEQRINFIGYGNSQMVYPNPKNSSEMSANRRVEIKILSK